MAYHLWELCFIAIDELFIIILVLSYRKMFKNAYNDSTTFTTNWSIYDNKMNNKKIMILPNILSLTFADENKISNVTLFFY